MNGVKLDVGNPQAPGNAGGNRGLSRARLPVDGNAAANVYHGDSIVHCGNASKSVAIDSHLSPKYYWGRQQEVSDGPASD